MPVLWRTRLRFTSGGVWLGSYKPHYEDAPSRLWPRDGGKFQELREATFTERFEGNLQERLRVLKEHQSAAAKGRGAGSADGAGTGGAGAAAAPASVGAQPVGDPPAAAGDASGEGLAGSHEAMRQQGERSNPKVPGPLRYRHPQDSRNPSCPRTCLQLAARR